MKKSTIYVRISEELKQKLKDYCDEHDMSMSEAIRSFIEKEVEPLDVEAAREVLNKISEREEEVMEFIMSKLEEKIIQQKGGGGSM